MMQVNDDDVWGIHSLSLFRNKVYVSFNFHYFVALFFVLAIVMMVNALMMQVNDDMNVSDYVYDFFLSFFKKKGSSWEIHSYKEKNQKSIPILFR